MKIVIYGMGKIFDQYKDMISWESVVAVVDKKAEADLYDGTDIPILSIEKIKEFDFDCIIIFSSKYFEEIKIDLVTIYNISENRIMSWWVFARKEYWKFSAQLANIYKKLLKYGEGKNFLDVGMEHLRKIFLSKFSLCGNSNVHIDGICREDVAITSDLYTNVYSCKEHVQGDYNAIFLWEGFGSYIDADTILRLCPQYVYYFRPYSFEDDRRKLNKTLYQYNVSESSLPYGWLSVFQRKRKLKNSSSIYVVTHKKTFIHQDALYIPVCVGKKYRNPDFLSAYNGENIEYLNDRINECTALYWIWKNTTSEYVGLNHYRRYFCQDSLKLNFRYLQEEQIDEIFNQRKYDIILPEITRLGKTLEQNIRNSVGNELYSQGLDSVRKSILKHQPQYQDIFEHVIGLDVFYACNMFVTRRSILNQYCEWLFSFLIEAAESLNVTQHTPHEKRTIGFFAELMWTVWVLKKRLKVYELPIMKIGE